MSSAAISDPDRLVIVTTARAAAGRTGGLAGLAA